MTEHKIIAALLLDWARNLWGAPAANPQERAMRVVEEAVEFAQAMEVNYSQAMAIVSRVYSRPVGVASAELGAVLLTAYSAAALLGYNPMHLLHTEVARVLAADRAKLKGKHDAKVAAGTAVEGD